MRLIFITFLFGIFGITLSAQTYINQNAGGANNGTSWDDAYTNLQDALDNTSSGDLWIAAGFYQTGTADADSSAAFNILTSINLYGGFDGTEVNLEDRDIEENETVLSADILNDDDENDPFANRADNSQHVIKIAAGINSVRVDGFIIAGGQTSDWASVDQEFRSGGGIYSESEVVVENCAFVYNFGRTGASIYLGDNASNSQVIECAFTENLSSSQAAGIFLDSIFNVTVDGSFFFDNETARGMIYSLRGEGHTIRNCGFEDNLNNGGFGGALFNWNSQNLSLINCIFEENISGNAGVLYNDAREWVNVGAIGTTIDSCFFAGNACGDFGGVLYFWQGTGISITNSEFEDNIAENAGAIYYDGRQMGTLDPNDFLIENCLFDGNGTTDFGGGAVYINSGSFTINESIFQNTAISGSGGFCFFTGDAKVGNINNTSFTNATIGGWGAAHTCYGDNSVFNITNCEYDMNNSPNLGGGVNVGFRSIANFDNCLFTNNSAASGGAIALQNDSTEVHVTNTEFTANIASNNGGAIFSGANLSSSIVSATSSLFQGNSAVFGGAVHQAENGDDDIGVFDVYNSTFVFNVVEQQGGAVNLVNANGEMINNVFSNNVATDPGTGGAISINSSSNEITDVSITNSTFDGNVGAFAAGISQWMENDSGSLTLTLQNNIFNNVGDNYVIENGEPTVISNGGNLDHDASFAPELNQPTDLTNLDPDFIDPNNFDYQLDADSPCINAGVADGAPTTDITGAPRDNMPDIGAYEFGVNAVKEDVIENNGTLRIAPNPVEHTFQLTLNNDWKGNLMISIFDVKGVIVKQLPINKSATEFRQLISVEELVAGNYFLTASNGELMVVEQMIKK